MKKITSILIAVLYFSNAHADHIIGGEMYHDFIGKRDNKNVYRITTVLYRDESCSSCATLDKTIYLGVFDSESNKLVPLNITEDYVQAFLFETEFAQVGNMPQCIQNLPALKFKAYKYRCEVALPENKKGYSVAYQICCRVYDIVNILYQNESQGTSYFTTIPGTEVTGIDKADNSPRFGNEVSVFCHNNKFKINFEAIDPDGDSLVYEMCASYACGNIMDYPPNIKAPNTFKQVNYASGFSASNPFGKQIEINKKSGEISGMTPEAGRYLFSICCVAYRDGKLLGRHMKDLILTIADCDYPSATLEKEYILCGTKSATFTNVNLSPQNKTYDWNFGDRSSGKKNEAHGETVQHEFTRPGEYQIMLIVNKGLACSDTAITHVHVADAIKARFSYQKNAEQPDMLELNDHSMPTSLSLNRTWDIFADDQLVASGTEADFKFKVRENTTYFATLSVTDGMGCGDTIYRQINTKDPIPVRSASTGHVNSTPYPAFSNTATLLFTTNQYTLSESDQSLLNPMIEFLKAHPKVRAVIEGHTDDVGPHRWNVTLSKKRARSIATYLISMGVSSKQIVERGWGESHPKDRNDTEDGKKNNRRGEIQLMEN